MSTTSSGRFAEYVATEYLLSIGHKIIAQNWRNRYCEIDIVSTIKGKVFFNEVKYRRNNAWGDGLDALNPKKLQQMEFAAQIWVANNNFDGPIVLQAISMAGEPPEVTSVIEI